MATIARIKQQRHAELVKVISAMKDLDAAQEKLERKLYSFRSKRKMLESTDIPILFDLFRSMVGQVNAVEKKITDMSRIVV